MHDVFLRRAIQLAADNVEQGRGGPFGAVITRDGKILAEGVNQVTSSHDPTAHAEIVAIREAGRKLENFDLRGCVIYASCEPCPMCLSAIYWARLDALFYAASQGDASEAGFDDSFLHEQITLSEEQRSLPTLRLPLHDAATRPFTIWRASSTKVPY